jgi:wobble nucleotide-excising tRNase
MEKYKSEYVYLFSLIERFKQNPTDDFEHLYNLPNVMRRMVEIFLNFKFLTDERLDSHIHLLVKDPIKCEKVRKFIHFYSHGLSAQTNALMTFPDLGECSSAAEILLESIKENDPVHFESLTREVSPPLAAPAPVA